MMETIAMMMETKMMETMMMETMIMETMMMETMMREAMIMETLMIEALIMETMMMEARGKGRGPLAFSTEISPPTFSERSEKKNILINVQNIEKTKKKIVNHLTALAGPS